MIKVMVVEDEPPILRDVACLIENVNPSFKVVFRAANGYEAIKILETELLDVVITDIQMPVVDGLELITHIKEKNYDIIPIILSGYSEFEYAKKAMSLGVTDYILKPLDENELRAILTNIENKLTLKKIENEKGFFLKAIENKHNDAIHAKPNYASYFIMLLCAGSFPTYTIDYYSPRGEFWRNTNIDNIINDILEKNTSVWIVDGKTEAEKVLIFTIDNVTNNIIDVLCKRIFQAVNSSKFAVTISVSPIFKKVEDIGKVLQALRLKINNKLVIGFPQIIWMSDFSENSETNVGEVPVIDSSTQNQLALYIRKGNTMSLKSYIKNIFTNWEQAKYPQIWVEKLLKNIVSILCNSLPGIGYQKTTEIMFEINETFSMSNSFGELFENVWNTIDIILDSSLENKTGSETMLILMQKVEKYIKANLSQPINTQVLSDMFSLVPSYLSKLFREYKGMSPTEYLVSLRVERAKELIHANPDMLSKEIAEIVGYSDPLYFSKIFKKETGMTPSEYKSSFKT